MGQFCTRLFFPQKRWTTVDPQAVQTTIQEALTQWGRPHRLRLDNGLPWGTTSDVPSALALWLSGLGIRVVFGRPGQSTDNAVIERSHGVLNQWCEPTQQADWTQLAERVDWAAHTQRERYRSPHHVTRMQAYPELATNPRKYAVQDEVQQWDVQRAAQFLAGYTFKRKVDKNGVIQLMNNRYWVGRKWTRQYVKVFLDETTYDWVIWDDYGYELCRWPSRELDYDLIRNLKLSKRRKSK